MKRGKYFVVLLLAIFAASCVTPEKLVKKGEYDRAIHQLFERLKKMPGDEKAADLLQEAYAEANSQNLKEIEKLRKTGDPAAWYPIYQNYNRLYKRQLYVAQLPRPALENINFDKQDFKSHLENARTKSAAYLYAHAKKLLKSGEKPNARQAYNELIKVSELLANYKSVDAMIRRALVQGTDNILYVVKNKTGTFLPGPLIYRLKNINFYGIDGQFMNFDKYAEKGVAYDFIIQLNLTKATLTPGKTLVTEKEFTQKARVKSRMKTDSSGKAIPVPEFENIKCVAKIYEQQKTATLAGYVDFIDTRTQQIKHTTPVSGKSLFTQNYVRIDGNEKACSPDVLRLTTAGPVQFPSDNDMIMDAAGKLRDVIRDVIWKDDEYFNN